MSLNESKDIINKYKLKQSNLVKNAEIDHIHDIKEQAYIDFIKKCDSNQELSDLMDQCEHFSKVLKYDRKKDSNFQAYQPAIYDGDYFYYSQDIYDKYRVIYNHWPLDKDIVDEEIKKINSSKFVFNKKTKLQHLDDKLFRLNHIYKVMKYSVETEKEQENLLKHKTEYMESVLNKIEAIEKQYASEIATEYVEKNPELNNFKDVNYNNGCRNYIVKNQKHYYEAEILAEAFKNLKTKDIGDEIEM